MQLTTSSARPLSALLMLAFAGAAGAEANPYFLGVSQSFSYDSNVFNLNDRVIPQPIPPSTQQSPIQSVGDTISITSLKAGIDQPFGRQRFYFTGNVDQNIFQHNSQLNNLSYGLDTGLDWQTIERLSGALRVTANQGLGGFNNYTTTVETFEKNIQDTLQGVATVRWGITPRVAIDGGYIYRRVDMSNPLSQNNEYSQNTGTLGLSYGDGAVLTLGAALRLSTTDYPKFEGDAGPPPSYQSDVADGKNLDLTATWVASGLSKLEGRLSWTDVSHSFNKANDFRGLTGSLRWEYRPTGKLNTRLSVLVAPGSGAAFNDFTGSTTPFVSNARSTTSVRMGASYLATGKITVNGSLVLENDRLSQEVGPRLGPKTIETGTVNNVGAQLGATYAAARNIDLTCYYRRDVRSTESSLSTPYSSNTFLCSAELLFQ